MNAPAEVARLGVYLSAYLAPFQQWLADENVTEILVNAPGEVWTESAGTFGMTRHDAPEIDDVLLGRLAAQVARFSHQGINRERPLLSATLPTGERIQIVSPPATRRHYALSIRRHRLLDVPLTAYQREGSSSTTKSWHEREPGMDDITFLKKSVRGGATILISGGTSSGKTTFLNALLREIPEHERLILVEDTPEIRLSNRNGVGLIAVKGETGEARVSTDDLLQAALRLRPDRIVLGELRGGEAVSFLRAINTGHPGSFSTIHANSPRGALEQLSLMVMQTGLGLSRLDTIAYVRSVVDLIVQLDRQGGQRGIAAIERTTDLFKAELPTSL
ncbi:P-type DNA transfer ATPase VirB11 [Sphingomonas sp. SM33]|uniref:Type IV secretion system protein n=1 Tax=Sphingomonas telluris TaxID=2907998 RepID=A0ABS9VR03_9SPHN|nr:P-type DNA transfer ATPase VirB11 [Sphingomonas telluris]MCH8617393.1 P-type DNA transfer ATPase VirB11 [Sphingomonas telluris]